MKRDMDLIREILFKIESFPNYPVGEHIEIPGHSNEEIQYHIFLLHDAGLIHGNTNFKNQIDPRYVHCLTWRGCEFLEAAKDDTRWNETKRQLGKIGANVFEIMFRVLVESAMKEITRN